MTTEEKGPAVDAAGYREVTGTYLTHDRVEPGDEAPPLYPRVGQFLRLEGVDWVTVADGEDPYDQETKGFTGRDVRRALGIVQDGYPFDEYASFLVANPDGKGRFDAAVGCFVYGEPGPLCDCEIIWVRPGFRGIPDSLRTYRIEEDPCT